MEDARVNLDALRHFLQRWKQGETAGAAAVKLSGSFDAITGLADLLRAIPQLIDEAEKMRKEIDDVDAPDMEAARVRSGEWEEIFDLLWTDQDRSVRLPDKVRRLKRHIAVADELMNTAREELAFHQTELKALKQKIGVDPEVGDIYRDDVSSMFYEVIDVRREAKDQAAHVRVRLLVHAAVEPSWRVWWDAASAWTLLARRPR